VNQFTTSLWGDEAFSAILSMKPIPEIIRVIIRDTSPPLYNITEHLWFGLFGTSEVAIRSLSFTYYLLAVFFVFLIGKTLWDSKTGLLASLLLFFNPFFFIYAFEGRMYSILALGVASSMYFFLKIMYPAKGERVGRGIIVGYGLSTAWALYSHHFSIFAVLIQGGWFLWELATNRRKVALNMFKGFLLAGVLYLPWIIPLYRQTKMVGGGFWLGTPTVSDFGNVVKEYLATGISHPLSKTALYFVFAALLMRRWQKEIKKTLFLLVWFLGPIALTWLVSQKFQSIFFNRYLLYAIPGMSLILASERRRVSGAVVLGILLGLFVTIDWWYFNHPTKRPFRELAAYVKEELRGDDFLINWNSGSHHIWESKYYGIPAPIYKPKGSGDLPFFVGTALMEEGDIISEIPEKMNRVGAITSGSVDEVNVAGYTEAGYREFGDLKFIWLQKL